MLEETAASDTGRQWRNRLAEGVTGLLCIRAAAGFHVLSPRVELKTEFESIARCDMQQGRVLALKKK
ncbi:hypothetical protein CA603_17260 [Paraburkholderia hospita]|nr:hypothetical protein CA603_17260 [Paraburkholderia hospita]